MCAVVSVVVAGTYNKTSLEFITYDTVYESARNTVANRLASSGQEWSQLFGEHNNGCYCNQFYVTDYNKFTPGKRPQPGTLWVLEQVRGRRCFPSGVGALQRPRPHS